jgi:hypothetical protein
MSADGQLKLLEPGHLARARYLGADAALAAATWLEVSETHARSILEDIDPAVLDQYDPPSLADGWSGGDPTPDSLALEVTGLALEADRARVAGPLAGAWEAGRDLVWPDALEAAALRRLERIDAAMYAEQRLERVVSALRQAAEL